MENDGVEISETIDSTPPVKKIRKPSPSQLSSEDIARMVSESIATIFKFNCNSNFDNLSRQKLGITAQGSVQKTVFDKISAVLTRINLTKTKKRSKGSSTSNASTQTENQDNLGDHEQIVEDDLDDRSLPTFFTYSPDSPPPRSPISTAPNNIVVNLEDDQVSTIDEVITIEDDEDDEDDVVIIEENFGSRSLLTNSVYASGDNVEPNSQASDHSQSLLLNSYNWELSSGESHRSPTTTSQEEENEDEENSQSLLAPGLQYQMFGDEEIY